ncbi:MAG: LysR family transcriptional regulator, partial [Bdellovibrionia bacterium]
MSLLGPQLEAFLSVVKRRTVHGAAGDLKLTQTGVTQRIRALERELGATLFLRSRRGMALTSEGEALLRYCQTAKDLEGQALAQIRGAGSKSQVSICLTGPTSMLSRRVIPQCFPVLKEYPEIAVRFDVTDIEDRAAALRDGSAQFAIV